MRLTSPTSKWNAIASGASKHLQWKVYIKKTSALTDALTAGTWVEITDRLESIPSFPSQIEYELGQFSSASIQLTGIGIDWFESNMLNASAYVELKAELQIGLSENNLASDVLYAFSGFVDLINIQLNEQDDNVGFSVFTADELSNRIASENIVTRYINSIGALEFRSITGLYVQDANITSYVLKRGVHSITYEYNSGTERAKLDDGRWVTLRTTDGNDTLGNAADAADDTERLGIYIDVSELSTSTIQENVIVKTEGDTLPYNWYRYVSINRYLSKSMDEFGITSQTFDTMQMSTWDSRKDVSFLDVIPNDAGNVDAIKAMVSTLTGDLFIALGQALYKRAYTTTTYSLAVSGATIGYPIERLLYDNLNNDVWIIYDTAGNTRVRVYDIDGASLSAETSMSLASTANSFDFFVDNRQVLFICNNTIKQISWNGTTFSTSQLATPGTMGVTTILNWGRIEDANNKYYVQTFLAGNYRINKIAWNGAAWVDDGSLANNVNIQMTVADILEGALAIYFRDEAAQGTIYYTTNGTPNLVLTLDAGDFCNDIFYGPNDAKIYATTTKSRRLYELSAGAATLVFDPDETTGYVTSIYGTMTYSNSYLFGIGTARGLWQRGATLNMYAAEVATEGQKIKQVMNTICQAWNLFYIISSIKKGYVYRRGDNSGNPVTSGNTITVTNANSENITKDNLYAKKFDLIRVSNGIETHSYDGTNFEKGAFGDIRVLELTNNMIPTHLIKDLLYWMWQYFKTDRSKYTIPLPLVTLFQYEPADELSLGFSGRLIGDSGDGIIIAQKLHPEGSMELEAVI